MERDCLIAYGASRLIFERMMLSSDPYEVQVFFFQFTTWFSIEFLSRSQKLVLMYLRTIKRLTWVNPAHPNSELTFHDVMKINQHVFSL